MGEGLIVRTQGIATTNSPIITEVSLNPTSYVFTITNTDVDDVVVFWELSNTSPQANSIFLEAGETTNQLTISNLNLSTNFSLYAFATTANTSLLKAQSLVVEKQFTTKDAYIVATGGGTSTYTVNTLTYKTHTFLETDDFSVQNFGSAPYNQVDYLIIAGGGGTQPKTGSGFYNGTGGGGAGGYRTTNGTSGGNSSAESKYTITETGIYTATVGAGGIETTGNNSSIFNIISLGGGAGVLGNNGVIGGSGGGGGYAGGNQPRNGGAGTSGQGSNGGNGSPSAGSTNQQNTGGGGGAGAVGVNAISSKGGNGGAGLNNLLRTGSNETRGGGGAGGGGGNGGSNATGGTGGGGNSITNGAANTGGGAGGYGSIYETIAGKIGGSGIVVIRYEIPTV